MSWERYAEHRDRVTSRFGGWTIGGESTMHGYNIHQQLGVHATWMQTMLLSATGKLPSSSHADFIEKIFILTGYPDARLWCNRVAALAGDAKCTATSSYSAGISSAEATLYGRQADYKAALLLSEAKRLYDHGGDEALSHFIENQLKVKRAVYGFGRPLLKADERIAPLSKEAIKLGLTEGSHLAVAYKVEHQLKKYKMIMNYGGYVMARLLDMNFSPTEIYRLLALAFFTGIVPCYIEAFEKEPGTFLPIACEDILYEGLEERDVPV